MLTVVSCGFHIGSSSQDGEETSPSDAQDLPPAVPSDDANDDPTPDAKQYGEEEEEEEDDGEEEEDDNDEGDDFDDFEEGDEDEDFDDFEYGFQQAEPAPPMPAPLSDVELPFVSFLHVARFRTY